MLLVASTIIRSDIR